MSKQRKPFLRWVGEALLIFLSVLGAFYFDNLREQRNQKEQYVRYLKDFRQDLKSNQGRFAYELSKQVAKDGRGYIAGNKAKYDGLYQLMTQPSRQHADSLMELINEGVIYGVTRWIFESPQYDKIYGEYYSFIKSDSVRSYLQLHRRNDKSRVQVKEDINQTVKDFEGIVDQMNLRAGGSRENQGILFGNLSVNTIRRMSKHYATLRSMTENAKWGDSVLLIHLDEELALWGNKD